MKRGKSVKALLGKTGSRMKISKSSANLPNSTSPATSAPTTGATPVDTLPRSRSKRLGLRNEANTGNSGQQIAAEPLDREGKNEPQSRDELVDESRSILVSTEEKLQKYVHDMRIEALFVEVVEELLVQAPDNPVKFILDYIANAFPNQAEESSFAKTFARSNAIGAGIPLTGVNANNDEYVPLSSDSDIDLEDDSEDDESRRGLRATTGMKGPDAEEKAEKAVRTRKRRGAVLKPMTSFTVTANGKGMQSDFQAAPEILRAMQNHCVLSQFDTSVLNGVASRMKSAVYAQGEVLCTQGEKNENFFIVQRGTVDLLVDDAVITTVCGDEAIASSVLLGDTVATETAKISSEEAEILCISVKDYIYAVRATTQKELSDRGKTLKKVSLFATFTNSEMENLAMAFESVTFQQRDVLFREHQPSSRMFIILEGEAMCTQQITSSSAPKPVVLFSTGDVFGESALFSPRPRAATVTAKSKELRCLVLERKKFRRLFGPILPIIARDEALLKRFVADKL